MVSELLACFDAHVCRVCRTLDLCYSELMNLYVVLFLSHPVLHTCA